MERPWRSDDTSTCGLFSSAGEAMSDRGLRRRGGADTRFGFVTDREVASGPPRGTRARRSADQLGIGPP